MEKMWFSRSRSSIILFLCTITSNLPCF